MPPLIRPPAPSPFCCGRTRAPFPQTLGAAAPLTRLPPADQIGDVPDDIGVKMPSSTTGIIAAPTGAYDPVLWARRPKVRDARPNRPATASCRENLPVALQAAASCRRRLVVHIGAAVHIKLLNARSSSAVLPEDLDEIRGARLVLVCHVA